tara:strand:+ start:136 stop:384 length:249 start_codon:yes stop_codon:yes gene_type:complete
MGRKKLSDIKNKFIIKSVKKYTLRKVKFVKGKVNSNTNAPKTASPIIFKYDTVLDIFSSLPMYAVINRINRVKYIIPIMYGK